MMSLASLAADCVGGISWTLLRTSRLVQAMVADPAPRRTPAAPTEVTAGDDAAAEIARLNQIVSSLQSQLTLETKKAPEAERLEEEPQGLQDEILKIRQELNITISGLQGEVASLTEQVKVSELEKNELQGAVELTLTTMTKEMELVRSHWKDVEKDNEDLTAERDRLLGLLHGMRLQLGAKDGNIKSIQGDMDRLKVEKQMKKQKIEQMQKDLEYKNWEMEELKKEVE